MNIFSTIREFLTPKPDTDDAINARELWKGNPDEVNRWHKLTGNPEWSLPPVGESCVPRDVSDFVHTVRGTLAQNKIVILYATAVNDEFANPKKIWPEIRDAEFRDAVLREIPEGMFLAPDKLDPDWTFHAYPPSKGMEP